jgi:hypothetical protein
MMNNEEEYIDDAFGDEEEIKDDAEIHNDLVDKEVEQVIRKNEHDKKPNAGGYLLPDDEDDDDQMESNEEQDEDEADNE